MADEPTAQAFLSALEWWEDSGVDIPPIVMPKPAKAPRKPLGQSKGNARSGATQEKTVNVAAPQARSSAKPVGENLEAYLASASAIARAAPTLEALKAAMDDFDAGDIMANKGQTVFARGNPKSGLMIIGESPGKEEDAAGMPFIGPSGKLLDKMLNAIGLTERDVYITNICHFRPLNYRAPGPEEIAICEPFIRRHIELAAPNLIVLAGRHALECLTDGKGITKCHGQWQTYEASEGKTIPALPLYHPAFLIRRPKLKAEAWRDLLTLKARLETPKHS